MTKERPILFSAPMVRAILDGCKTQTRRIVNPQPEHDAIVTVGEIGTSRGAAYIRYLMEGGITTRLPCPYGQPGDRLWVRETFVIESNHGIESESIYKPPFDDSRPIKRTDTPDERYWQQCHYRATDPAPELYYENTTEDEPECKWKPSIHMPRWASRILLEITGVRIERLQNINEADAIAEGCYQDAAMNGTWTADGDTFTSKLDGPIRAYRMLWESINGPGSWDANPWVWVIEFKRIKP